MKMKKFWLGGGASLAPPLDPPLLMVDPGTSGGLLLNVSDIHPLISDLVQRSQSQTKQVPFIQDVRGLAPDAASYRERTQYEAKYCFQSYV